MPPKGRKILKAKRTSGAASTATQAPSTSNATQARETSEPTANKYESIEACWMQSDYYKTVLINSSETFEAEGTDSGPPEEEEEIELLKKKLDNAVTEAIIFYIGENSEHALNFYSSIFSTLRVEKYLDFEFFGDHDYSEFFLNFLPVITRGRDLSGIEMRLKWDKTIPQNLQKTRQALQLLPKMKELEINYHIKNEGESVYGEVFDDATIRHLVTCAEMCRLGNAPNVTAQGLLAAFEAFCGVSEDRTVIMHIEDSTIDEVFDIVEESEELKEKYDMGTFGLGERYLRINQANKRFCFEEARKTSMDTTPIVMFVRDERE